MAAFLRRVVAFATGRQSPTDLGMRWGAGNSSNHRRVPKSTCRRGNTLATHVIHYKNNYLPFSRP